MARRKNDTPQKAAIRELMQGYLRDNDISIKIGTNRLEKNGPDVAEIGVKSALN